jgi:hypothetical protein
MMQTPIRSPPAQFEKKQKVRDPRLDLRGFLTFRVRRRNALSKGGES